MKITVNCTAKIVIPKKATEREQFAARELKKYIGKICGADLSICTESQFLSGDAIAIGGPERNSLTGKYISEAEFDKTVPGPEGLFIKAYDNCLVLAGSSKNVNENERGTVYAVYEWLERFVGCSFAAYTKEGVPGGEYVPELKEIDVSGIAYCKAKADLPMRGVCPQYSDWAGKADHALNVPFLDWLCKNRYNYIYTWNSIYEQFKENGMLEACLKRGFLFMVGHHDSIDTLLPQRGNKYFSEHYFETHPEYYKLTEDGKRFEMVNHGGQMVLCSRNEDMIDQIAENLIAWLKQNPLVKSYALSNKDGTAPQCCCEKCRPYSKVENFFYMINSIAKKVAKVFPDVKIAMSAYTDLWEPPEGVTDISPNIYVKEATWGAQGADPSVPGSGLRTVGKPDGTCIAGTHFEENLLSWRALGVSVMYYDYLMGVYPGRQRYIPMGCEMQAFCRRFVEKGIEGMVTQFEPFNHWNNLFNYYTYGRTAYDCEKSMEDNLALFCRIFGEGGSFIAENIRYAETVLDGQSKIQVAGIYLMEHIDKQRMYRGFENALAAAETPAARNNIRLMRMAFRYSEIDSTLEAPKKYTPLRHYDIPERGELLYMQRNFDSFVSHAGYGIMIPVEGEDNGFTPDKWYLFEENDNAN